MADRELLLAIREIPMANHGEFSGAGAGVSPGSRTTPPPQSGRKQLRARGKSLREKCPRGSHAAWRPGPDRHDPIRLLEQSNEGRLPQLIPIRHGRMLRSPFTFYRGTALNMAADLATTPTSGPRVQACGDCHLSNFGAFATPERRVIVDINDLDETLPAPWEWDVKRLAASVVLAGRNNGHSEDDARDAVLSGVRSYRERMSEYAEANVLDVWYASIGFDDVVERFADGGDRKRLRKRLAKARERTVMEHEFPELAHAEGGTPKIKDNPPLIFHLPEQGGEEFDEVVRNGFAAYRMSLPEHRRVLLDHYRVMDCAVKVVGVGSVGTTCGILLVTAHGTDPLFLQIKQARPSVLEPYAGKSAYAHQGQRVVVGHHLMQAASDLFLGWADGRSGRQFYVRQLRDMKIKPLVERFTPRVLSRYAELCGWILARAHARSGEPALIAGYLGKSDRFDEAVADFAAAYADQAERDHAALKTAVRDGRLEAIFEEQ